MSPRLSASAGEDIPGCADRVIPEEAEGRGCEEPAESVWREGTMFPLWERNISGMFCTSVPVFRLGERDLEAEDVLEAVPIVGEQ